MSDTHQRFTATVADSRVAARCLVAVAVLLAGGCTDEAASTCGFSGECASGMVCVAGTCVAAGVDAGSVAPDAGAGQDAGIGPRGDASTAVDGSIGPDASRVTALPTAFSQLARVDAWGVTAPTNDDYANWVASGYTLGIGESGFPERGAGGTYDGVYWDPVITSISQLPTITCDANGGGVRFGPTVLNGVPCILHSIRENDAVRWDGNRSGLMYDGYRISHGEDHWFAFAFKFGPEWTAANGGGHGDRQSIFDVHQDAATAGHVGPFGLAWYGDSPGGTWTGRELWWVVSTYDDGTSAYLYNEQATPGQWMRVIIHYRSGSAVQGPLLDTWVANGAGDFRQLPKCIDPYTGTAWTTTPAFGDPLTNTLPQYDWMKLEVYKWTRGAYGSATNRNLWTSEVFAARGLDRYDEAVQALAPWATND